MAAENVAVEMAVDVEPKVEVGEETKEKEPVDVEKESVEVIVEAEAPEAEAPEAEAEAGNEEQEVDVEGVEGDEKPEAVLANGEGDGSADQPEVGAEPETEDRTDFISERRKRRRLEVFVGGLDKETTEDDLTAVFQKAGEVEGVRLMKNPQSGKCKGFAFVRYATAAQAKEATKMFKEVEIRGRMVGVLASEENDTLFVGNINRTWTKDAVVEALTKLVGKVEEFTLMEDPQSEGMNRGFGFAEFTSHKEASKALQRLSQPDANFGHERSAKVAWAEPLSEPDEEIMSQVKSVFVNGMPPLWEEEKAREFFAKFGEIEKIELARNMNSAKRKDFGFVHYKEREAALACIEAVNNTEIVDGELKMKVKVSLAKPQTKKGGVRGAVRGGFIAGGRGEGRGGRAGRGRFGQDEFGSFPGRGLRGFDAGRGGRGFRGGRFGPGPFGGFGGRGGGRGPVREFGDESNSYTELLKVLREQDDKDDVPAKKAAIVKTEVPSTTAPANGEVPAEGTDGVKKEKEVIPADKYECSGCGFGSDVESEYHRHLRTKVHKIVQSLRTGEKQVNKTPLSLLHEYASRNKCEVTYDTKSEGGLAPYEITANLGPAATGTSGQMKGTAGARAKNKAKQMAASAVLEQLMRIVPEAEFTRPGAARLREAAMAGGRGRGRGFPGSFGGRGAYVPEEGYGGDRGFGYGAGRGGFEGREFGGAREAYRQQERLPFEGRGAGFVGGPPPAYEREIGVRPAARARFAGGYEGGRRAYEEPYVEEGRAAYEADHYAPSARRVGLPPAYAVRAAAAPAPQQAPRYEEPPPTYSTRFGGGSRYESASGLSAVERQPSHMRAANLPPSATAPTSYSLPATGYVEDARVVIGAKRPYGSVEELPRYGDTSRAVQRARVEEPQQQTSLNMAGSQYRTPSSYYTEPTRAPAAAQRVQQYGGYTSSNAVEARSTQQNSPWTLSSSAGANTALQSNSQQPYSYDQPSPYVAAGAQATTTPVGGGLYQTNTGYGVSYSVSGDYLTSTQTPSVPTYQSAYNTAGATTQQAYGSAPSNQSYY